MWGVGVHGVQEEVGRKSSLTTHAGPVATEREVSSAWALPCSPRRRRPSPPVNRHDIGVEEVQESAHARLTGLFDPEPACGLSSHALDSRDLGNCAIDGTVERALS